MQWLATCIIDVGTSSLRSVLIDTEGSVLKVAQEPYPLEYDGEGAVEMDLGVFTEALWASLAGCGAYARENSVEVAAFAVTSQRSSVIPVDKDGKAVRNALMWQDTRSAGLCREKEESERDIYQITGMRLSPVFSAPKMQYLRRVEPNCYDSAYKLLGFCEYVLHEITGAFRTDHSIASRTGLFNVSSLEWDDSLLSLYEVDKEKLCGLMEVGAAAGNCNDRVCALFGCSHVPVISAGGDQQCAALGLGCLSNGDFSVNVGTGAYVIAVTDRPVLSYDSGVSCNVSAIEGKWITEGSVLSAGKSQDWVDSTFFKSSDETHRLENFTKACHRSVPGSHGLMFSVHMTGKGTPEWDPERTGAFLGLNPSVTKDDFARATLEGIAFAVDECLSTVRKAAGLKKANAVRVSGGLCNDVLFNQIQASAYGLDIVSFKHEATMMGAWISAAVALGWYPSPEEAFIRFSSGQEPWRMSPLPEEAAVYEQIKRKIKLYKGR